MSSRSETVFRRLASFTKNLDEFDSNVATPIAAHIIQFENAWKVSKHDGEIPSGFHFLTERGLEQLGEASPGSAGRNRTLGIEALERIKVPVPSMEKQIWFDLLQTKVDALKQLQAETSAELDALLPSVLDKAFKGEL